MKVKLDKHVGIHNLRIMGDKVGSVSKFGKLYCDMPSF
jgi:hypothetical protein